jgi:hypothetical protein
LVSGRLRDSSGFATFRDLSRCSADSRGFSADSSTGRSVASSTQRL